MPKATKKPTVMAPVPAQDKIQFEVKADVTPEMTEKDIFEGYLKKKATWKRGDGLESMKQHPTKKELDVLRKRAVERRKTLPK
tara:strand:+ start:1734 stop:1982 length:249 start_codon:yes stop_codon:yes gene_type:complete